ncbi:carboxynorspermidine decarboxylase [Alteromonadaceae bacterium Bs31]|nr:carboxynorspermidine decarboxylase [Alteromonadaceae bacterium Bs31]
MSFKQLAHGFDKLDLHSLPSPCYVVDEAKIEDNLRILHYVQEQSGAKILLALKAFSMYSLAPLVMKYLKGVCASGLNEAKLGREEFNGEVHSYAAAFRPQEFAQIVELSDHVVFNSCSQWAHYREQALSYKNSKEKLSFGVRINPQHSEGETPLYDPCAPCSRMGIRIEDMAQLNFQGLSGLHFHTLCEHNFDPLARTLDAIEKNYGQYLHQVNWVNFGGGHHITREDYDREKLIHRIKAFRQKYNVEVYLEPGEAIALNAGVLVTEVLDTLHNSMDIAIIDASATCHMPDVLEMPYRPVLTGAADAGKKPYTYRLGGPSCLAGDVVGDYSFDRPLHAGDRFMFEDMAIYTMVKNTTFNGINLPAIVVWDSTTQQTKSIKHFSYRDFKQRLS